MAWSQRDGYVINIDSRLGPRFSSSGLPSEHTLGTFHYDATARTPLTNYLPREITSSIATPKSRLFAYQLPHPVILPSPLRLVQAK